MTKFAYFGTPYVARDTLMALFAAGYIPELVISSPDAAKGRGLTLMPCETKEWARENSIPVLTPAELDTAFLEELSSYGCEYGIAVAYGKIVPQSVINSFPKGILNVHYSLLPKYRGASPVEMALWNGDTKTGVSIQKMVFELDAGDILAQEVVSIDPEDTTLSLRPRLIEHGASLLINSLPGFLDGSTPLTPQDPSLVSRARKIHKEQGHLVLGEDASKNWNTYRALRESPGTYFFARKSDKQIRVKIIDAAYEHGTFVVYRIVPEGKGEQPFSYLAQAGFEVVS